MQNGHPQRTSISVYYWETTEKGSEMGLGLTDTHQNALVSFPFGVNEK